MVRFGFEIAATALVIFLVLWLGLNLINAFVHSLRGTGTRGNLLLWVVPKRWKEDRSDVIEIR